MSKTTEREMALYQMWRNMALSFREDVSRLLRSNRRLRAENEELRAELELQRQQWWAQQDEDEHWISAMLADTPEDLTEFSATEFRVRGDGDVIEPEMEPDYPHK